MEYDQIQINRQVIRIPLVTPATTRGHNLGYDALLQNAFVETTASGKKMVRKRPGYYVVDALNYASGAATGQGLTFYSGRYYAVADDILYRLGATQTSYSDGTSWLTSGTASTFGPRYGHSVVSFKGKIFSIGGGNGTGTSIGDIWSSSDGFNWDQVVPSAPWGMRSDMGVVVHNGQLWAMGGSGGAGYHNDVWSSSDGVNWTLVNPSATWAPRSGFGIASFNNQIVILGGFVHEGSLFGGADTWYQEVWSSSDGEIWVQLPTPTWSARSFFGTYVSEGKLVVAGGMTAAYTSTGTVYDTSDAQSWTLRTGSFPVALGSLAAFAYTVYNSKLWAVGGLVGTGAAWVDANDVYSSSDGGANWTLVTAAPGFTDRAYAQLAVSRTPSSVSAIQATTMFLLGGSTPTASSATYYAVLNQTGSSSFTITTDASTYEPFQFNQITPSEYLIFKNRYNGYVLWGNEVIEITTTNYPTRTVPGLVYLNRRTYVMDPNGFIYGSDLDDPTTFPAFNYIEAEYEPDKGIALAKYLNYIVAFGERTIQFFYDGGSFEGSALIPQQNMTQRIGCINGYTVVSMEGLLAFVGRGDTGGRAVFVIDNGRPAKISTEEIERLLESEDQFDVEEATFFSTGYGVVGHKFYLLNLPTHDVAIVYDFTEKEWHIENYNNASVLPFSGYITDTGGNYLQNSAGGTIFALTGDYYSDNGTSIVAMGVTDNTDYGTYLCKYQHSATLICDRAATGGTTITLEWSDDDYQTWSPVRFIQTNQAKPWTHRGGRFYRRAYRWTHSYDLPFRAEALEVQLDFGNV